MIIYATMSAKNESDIIGESLEKALLWADKIFVVDNGSQDSTLEIVRTFGDRVVVLATFYDEFQRGLKSIPFNWVNANPSYARADWWCVMDADEVYFDDPKEFLRRVPAHFGRVCTNTMEFIGLVDGSRLLSPESYSHCIPLDWSESRFFRNAKSLHWGNFHDNGPRGVGATYHQRIRVMHFPFRTAQQIKGRMETRDRNRKEIGIPWFNADYETVDDFMARYNANRRVQRSGQLEFGISAQNFLASPRDKLTTAAKVFLHRLGFYR